MACRIDYKQNPVSEIRDAVEKKKYAFETFPDQTQEETAAKLDMYRNIVTTELVSNEELGQGYHLDPSGKTMRYVWVDTKSLAFKNRVTDKSKAKFVKKKGKLVADALGNTPDNINKKELGTALHSLAENIMNLYLHTFDSEFIDKSNLKDKPDIIKLIKENEYLKDYFLTTSGNLNDNFTNFSLGVKEILENAIETQKNINPAGKFKVYTEQFIPDFKKNTGGTIDLLILYSNNTADVYDYKSVHIDDPKITDEKGNINSHNWLPEYKLEDFNTQIPILVDMLEREGITKVNKARIVPIHAQLKYKGKDSRKPGNNLLKSPKIITMSTRKEEFLTQIPLIPEDLNSATLNKAIEESYKLLNNLSVKLEKLEPGSPNYHVVKKRIARVNKSVTDIIIKREFKNINDEFKNLLSKYTDKNGFLLDTDNRKTIVNGEEVNNYNYLSLEQIDDLINDIKIFQIIAGSSIQYVSTLSVAADQDLDINVEELDKYIGTSNRMLADLEQKKINRVLSKEEYEQAKADVEIGVYDKFMSRFSELPNTIIQKARSLFNEANDTTRIEFQKFEKQLKKVAGDLENWGQSKGLNAFETYKYLIDTKTGDLHRELKKDVYERLEEAKANKNDEVIDSIYTLKKDAKKLFEKRKENYKFNHNITNEEDKDFQKWLKFNSPEELKYTKDAYKYYEIDYNKLKNSDFTPEYLIIKQNKPLLDYYNFWTESMGRFRNMYEFKNSYQKIPNNFIPWIKKSMLENFMTSELFGNASTIDLIKNQMLAQQEDKEIDFSDNYVTVKGQIDPDTGRAKREIPRMFTNPLRNANGEIDGTLKSFDLNASMLTFAYSAFNYNEMKKIEATVDALKDVLASPNMGLNQKDAEGNEIRHGFNKIKAKIYGESLDEVALFNKIVDYHMYGIKVQEVSKLSQFALKAKRYQQLKELGLAIMSPIVNVVGAKTNSYFEGVKGYYYTKQMLAKATKDRGASYGDGKKSVNLIGDKSKQNLYFALANFFEPYQGKKVGDIAKKYKGNKALKKLSLDTMFALWRNGDEHIEESVMYAMMQNYGIQNGKIVRIGNKQGIKSLLDSARLEGDDLIIDGLIDKEGNVNVNLYSDFRQTVLNVNASIKGSMNEEDMNAVNMNIAGNLMMSYKNWMPGLIAERFKGVFDKNNTLRYNAVTKTITQARYTALVSELGLKDEDVKITNFFFKVFSPSMVKFLAEVSWFGKVFTKGYKISEDRAKTEFLDFKYRNKNNPTIQNYSFEDFLEYKQGQIKALAAEVRVITILISILAALGGDWDDDGDKDYKESWLGRQSYRFFNRYRREMMSLINPNDWKTLFTGGVFPVASLGIDFQKWLANTFDVTRDMLIEQNSSQDKSPIFYETHQWIPGYKFFDMFELFEQSKKKEY